MDIFGLSLLATITVAMTLIFEFVNGFHDSANSIATIVATKVLSPVAAVSMAAVFNFVGINISLAVAKTIGKGIIDTSVVPQEGVVLVFCAVAGAVIWDLITWWFGIPTSSSHALVGGLIGAGVAAAGVTVIVWSGTLKTVSFIVISPLVGLAAAFGLTVLVMRIARKISRTTVNRYFRRFQLASSAFYSVTHGTNDGQKGMGIVALVLIMDAGGSTAHGFPIPLWVMVACQTAISLGTFFGGWRIVKTLGFRMTRVDPVHGFSIETASALTIIGSSILGIPVSTTHVVSGSVMGSGATLGASTVRWGVARRIIWAWLITIPASAIVAAAAYLAITAA